MGKHRDEKAVAFNKKRFPGLKGWIGLIGLFACIFLIFYTVFPDFYEEVMAGEKFIPREEQSSGVFRSSTDAIRQYFVPRHRLLKSIDIRLMGNNTKNNPNVKKWRLLAVVKDAEGNALKEQEITYKDFKDWEYYEMELDLKVKAGSTYCLEIRQTKHEKTENKVWEVSFECFAAAMELDEYAGCYFNDQPIDNIDITITYTVFNWLKALCMAVAAAFVILLGSVAGRIRRWGQAHRQVGVIVWAVSPLAALVASESITENLNSIARQYMLPNIVISFALLVLLTMVFRKARMAAVIHFVLHILLALAVYFVHLFRGRALSPFDFLTIRTAATVAGNYQFLIPIKSGFVLLGVLAWMILQAGLVNLEWRRRKAFYLVRGLGAVAAVAILGTFVKPLPFFDPLKDIESWLDFWITWNNYREKGMLVTLAAETRYVTVDPPENYSAKRVNDILSEQDKTAEALEKPATVPENVIVIMNESLADLGAIGDLKASEDPLPFIHALRENTVKGFVEVPVFGAGTAETEYEFLTGNAKLFLPPNSVAYHLFCRMPEYGLPYDYKLTGSETVALHPYYATNWNREDAYEKMQFDAFYAVENWGEKGKTLRWCMSDASVYKRIVHLIKRKEEHQKMFVFCVTMQNHGGYNIDPETDRGFEPYISLNCEGDYPDAEMYLSLVRESDKAFEALVNYYEQSDEPTMIVMFGDHLPALNEDFYTELFGSDVYSMSMESAQKRYQTPFVIWTNYEQESKTDELMSINYLGSYVMQRAGMDLPAYNRFLLKLHDSIPVIGRDAVRDGNGDWHPMSDLPQEYADLLNQYAVVQYGRIFRRNEVDVKGFMPGCG